MDKDTIHDVLSEMGKKGYKKLLEITSEEQRQAWREKGAKTTRLNALKRKRKK